MSDPTDRENFGHSPFIGASAYAAGFLNAELGFDPWWSLRARPPVAMPFSPLTGRPTLLLLDEPSVGIPTASRARSSIRAIHNAGTTILPVEQDARSTVAVADRIYGLENGYIAREGRPQDLTGAEAIRQAYPGI